MGVGMWMSLDDTEYPVLGGVTRHEIAQPFLPGKAAGRARERGNFPERYWNADFRALLTTAEFARTDWQDIEIDWPPDEDETQREIGYLLGLRRNRSSDCIKAVIAQNAGFLGYFLDLMMMTPASHPETFHIMKISCRVSELTMAYFKDKFNRARPSQLCPDLIPPVAVSGHPSYPSGHSLTAHLIAYCLADVCPEKAEALRALADGIGVNRELAGFHYPSDTEAGRIIAERAHELLRDRCPKFRENVGAAEDEWRVRQRG
jgi:membrane-associated phospholipid phosphatase